MYLYLAYFDIVYIYIYVCVNYFAHIYIYIGYRYYYTFLDLKNSVDPFEILINVGGWLVK